MMICAIILAAGESRRMGEQKMLMKWGQGTVLGHVISVFIEAGLRDILVVSGSDREKIEELVAELAKLYPVRCVYNAGYKSGGMLSTIQRGLQDVAAKGAGAALIGLGDQPQVEERSVRMIREEYEREAHPLIVPSHAMRRGHPWLVGREYWNEILELRPPQTPRDFLNRHAEAIRYVDVGNDSILADLDTPADYKNSNPGWSSHNPSGSG
jgi:molybdenum cofactor cytidylyltransferase